MTDAQMRLLVWALVAAFLACALGLVVHPVLPFAVAGAGVVFAFYLASVLLRARSR